MTSLPIAGRVAWWGTALLAGHVGPDEFDDALGDDYVAHVVLGADSLAHLLRASAEAGARGVAAVFPEPGDPFGLAGPAAFNADALDAGEAVLTVGPGAVGAVPHPVGRAMEWHTHPVGRRPPPDLGEADRELRSTLLRTAEDLARLDVARWRPEVADALHSLREGVPLTAPPGIPGRAADLARRALHLMTVVDLALVDDGAAVSATEARAREDVVVPLGRAARRALTAACSPDGWPPAEADPAR
ncbi:hypothetical protein KUV85_04800 [Nocardioides panacisoli]|uniref:hypothetical protein n=1 Tax=Nocardioides panacisoli TaxID=627624 RepID=UPI001C635F40|nr:hypothetical protein [Nocardioides panacisoli]QYJ05009.1 hypothetical protein KUV85_04800 [Nocardioides panacisoli]